MFALDEGNRRKFRDSVHFVPCTWDPSESLVNEDSGSARSSRAPPASPRRPRWLFSFYRWRRGTVLATAVQKQSAWGRELGPPEYGLSRTRLTFGRGQTPRSNAGSRGTRSRDSQDAPRRTSALHARGDAAAGAKRKAQAAVAKRGRPLTAALAVPVATFLSAAEAQVPVAFSGRSL